MEGELSYSLAWTTSRLRGSEGSSVDRARNLYRSGCRRFPFFLSGRWRGCIFRTRCRRNPLRVPRRSSRAYWARLIFGHAPRGLFSFTDSVLWCSLSFCDPQVMLFLVWFSCGAPRYFRFDCSRVSPFSIQARCCVPSGMFPRVVLMFS
jgi:hypothetical protein